MVDITTPIGTEVTLMDNGGSTVDFYDSDNTATATGGNNTFNLFGPSGATSGDALTIDMAGSVINGETGTLDAANDNQPMLLRRVTAANDNFANAEIHFTHATYNSSLTC
jgi:hypothetical protein